MLILLPIAILSLTAISLFTLPRLRPGFSSGWLLAAGGAFFAWVSLYLQSSRLPESIALATWRPTELFANSPELVLDDLSWPLAVAIASIAFSVLLIDVRRAAVANWLDWILVLVFAALGILAVFSANWLTLVLLWTILDYVLFFILLFHSPQPASRQKLVTAFSANLLSTLILITGIMVSTSTQVNGENEYLFGSLSIILLILAIGMRLGIVSYLLESVSSDDLHLKVSAYFHYVSAAVTLIPVLRIDLFGFYNYFSPYLIGISLLAGLYGAVRWVRAKDALTGTPYWIFAAAFMAVGATLIYQQHVAMVWVLIMVYAGSFANFTHQEGRRVFSFAAVLLVTISTLPYIPSLIGGDEFAKTSTLSLVGLIAVHALLVFGYAQKTFGLERKQNGDERWLDVIFFIGIAWLPLTFIGSIFRMNILNDIQYGEMLWWPVGVIVGVASLLSIIAWRGMAMPSAIMAISKRVFSLRWLTNLSKWGVGALQNFVKLITTLLEGEGGMLWALLLIAMLATLLVQVQAGG